MMRNVYESFEEFALEIDRAFTEICKDKDLDHVVNVIAKYDEMKHIIRELCILGYGITSVEICDPGFNGYYDEYVLSVSDIDDAKELYCEKFKRDDDKYIIIEDGLTYLLDNCSHNCMKTLPIKETIEIAIGEDEELEDDDSFELDGQRNEYAYVSKDKDGKPVAFTKSWGETENGVTYDTSFSYRTNNLENLKEMAALFGIKM